MIPIGCAAWIGHTDDSRDMALDPAPAPPRPVLAPPRFLAASLALLTALIVIWAEPKDRRLVGALVAVLVAVPSIVITDEICKAYPWLIECWCKWCL